MANTWDEDEDKEQTAYYAILNVPRDATPEEITKSYRRLAQVFHPDKHIDEANRKQAQESFSKVQEAYEVLSDPYKRQVYDVYGKQGLAAGRSSSVMGLRTLVIIKACAALSQQAWGRAAGSGSTDLSIAADATCTWHACVPHACCWHGFLPSTSASA